MISSTLRSARRYDQLAAAWATYMGRGTHLYAPAWVLEVMGARAEALKRDAKDDSYITDYM